jgi:hypothetical protein
MTHQEPKKQKFIQVVKSQVVGTVKQLFPPFKDSSTQISALLLAAGLSFSALFPVYAASTASQAESVKQNTQLISQKGNKEITLVSYAVTKAAYEKIIPKVSAQ